MLCVHRVAHRCVPTQSVGTRTTSCPSSLVPRPSTLDPRPLPLSPKGLSVANRTSQSIAKETAHEVHDVWNAIDDLRSDVGTIKASQAALVAKFDQVVDTIRQLNQDRRTPWGVIIGAIGVALSMITAVGGAALAPLYLSDAFHNQQLREHIQHDGHPVALMRQAGIQKDVIRLDGNVNELKSQIRSLDDTLQQELRELLMEQTERLAKLETTTEKMQREQENHTARVYGGNE